MSWLKIINIHRNRQSTHSHVCVALTFQITWLYYEFCLKWQGAVRFPHISLLWESRGDTIQIANLPEWCIFMQIKPICRQLNVVRVSSKQAQPNAPMTDAESTSNTNETLWEQMMIFVFNKTLIHTHTHTHVGFIDAAVCGEKEKNIQRKTFSAFAHHVSGAVKLQPSTIIA